MVEKLVMVTLTLLIIDNTLGNHKALKVASHYTWKIHFQIKQFFSLPLKIIQDHYYLFSYKTSNSPLTLQANFWQEKNSQHLFMC